MISHSEAIGSLMAAILAVQQDVDHVEKGAKNPHFGNTYADLNTFLRALRGPLAEHGIVMTQAPGMDEGTVTVETMLVHESGEWIRNRAAAPMQKNDPQGVGSAITYLRRYSLAALFAVPQEDDDGNAASRGRGNGRSRSKRSAKGEEANYHCPECGGPMWDNRRAKESGEVKPKYPDFKCQDKQCDEAIWGSHPDEETEEASAGLIDKAQGLLDMAKDQELIFGEEIERVEAALESKDKQRVTNAHAWLQKQIRAAAQAQAGETETEGAPA